MPAEMFATLVNAGVGGAVIAVVLIFLNFVEKRDKESRAFFESIRAADRELSRAVVEELKHLGLRVGSLEDKFDRHDATETEFLRAFAVQAAQDRKTKPRGGAAAYPKE